MVWYLARPAAAGSTGMSDLMLTFPTLKSCPRSRLLAVAIMVLVTTGCPPVSAAEGPGSAIVLKPGTRVSGKDWAYLYRRAIPNGVLIPLAGARSGSRVALSPDGAYVAYRRIPSDRPEAFSISDSSAAYEVAVADTAGHEMASFIGAVRFAWCPTVARLAIGIGCKPWIPVPPFDSVVVWEPEEGITSRSHVPASRGLLAWAGPDTVIVGSSVLGPARSYAWATGTIGRSNHRGAKVSPDGLYSIQGGRLGIDVMNDRSGANNTYSVVELLGIRKLGAIGPADWMQSGESGHALAISVCTPSGECRTGLVDVGAPSLMGWFTGKLIGLTADSREAVVADDSSFSFVGDNDWRRDPPPATPPPDASASAKRLPHSPGRGLLCAFTMHAVWGGDNGRLAVALGYRSGPVYVMGSDGRTRELVDRPDGFWPYQAMLNRSADLVAILGHASDPGPVAVLVADSSGAVLTRFPGRSRFRWSRDGSRLALVGGDLLVWDRRKGEVRTIALRPDDEAWTTSGDLLLRIHDRVLRYNPNSGDTTRTSHRAVLASPDGNYSIDGFVALGIRAFDDRRNAEITRCSWGNVHELLAGLCAPPLWSSDPSRKHHLWINRCDARLLGYDEGKLIGCETFLVDVETMERTESIDGKLISPTPDGRSIVVLRGDHLEVAPLEAGTNADVTTSRPGRSTGRTARLSVVVSQWGRGFTRTVGVDTLEVRDGDWLPDWTGNWWACDRGMRIRSVMDRDQVEIEYNPNELLVGSATTTPGVALLTSGATTSFRTNSADGGRTIQVRIIR